MAFTTATGQTGLSAPSRLALLRRFSLLPLHHRFALVGSFVMLIGMLVIGNHVATSIEESVVRNSAISSAVYMESFIAPMSQELAESNQLSAQTVARMRALLESPPLSDRILSIKIWQGNGRLAFSGDDRMIGQIFPPSDELLSALSGNLTATFDELDDEESLLERERGVPLLEVYNPIHSILTGEVIAVAEFYLEATELEGDLKKAQSASWAIVGLVTLATFAALFGIVRSGSRTIAAQNRALKARLDELARISTQNRALRDRVQAASRGVSETNERYMRRVSAELHDGPAQALALAALRFDPLIRRSGLPADDPEVTTLRNSLNEALSDVRDLCRGLTLPEIEGRSLRETLDMAISAHERRSGETVRRLYIGVASLATHAPHPLLICIYRFTQEALMNSFRHAKGSIVSVDANFQGDRLAVSISDTGQGFAVPERLDKGLGLAGLRERVESIGGEFLIASGPETGTRVTCILQLDLTQ
ncbi:sensor histidine kinase [Thioclava sp. FR2]|uniref:sensor histidine kinase n=1 Tax=Thioclava sp. FR2 TaxID=3445780 RepID=UPI003EBE83B1